MGEEKSRDIAGITVTAAQRKFKADVAWTWKRAATIYQLKC